MDATLKGAGALAAALRSLERKAPQAAARALARCGLLAVREAKANAPRSPTMRQRSASLKRKKRTCSRTLPGGLEKSIEREMRGLRCAVFVAANSYAGKYARRIHDEKGVSWRKRGPGTVAKGPRADEKFIERAIRDNEPAFRRIIDAELSRVMHL